VIVVVPAPTIVTIFPEIEATSVFELWKVIGNSESDDANNSNDDSP
jgi:hypothetical protein